MKNITTMIKLAECIEPQIVQKHISILDLGCGNGGQVQNLRDIGFDAYGVDVKFKEGENVEHLESLSCIRKIELDNYHIPFPNESFDIVFSEQVFEHVHNYKETLQELNRVMKAGAIGVHRFPSRLRPVESHVKVPFSSVIRNHRWMLFWTRMGFAKKDQKSENPEQVAQKNLDYLNNSTNYLTGQQILRKFKAEFPVAKFAEKYWFMVSPNKRGRMLGNLDKVFPFFSLLYRTFWTRVVYHKK